jgi:hypothetical protein
MASVDRRRGRASRPGRAGQGGRQEPAGPRPVALAAEGRHLGRSTLARDRLGGSFRPLRDALTRAVGLGGDGALAVRPERAARSTHSGEEAGAPGAARPRPSRPRLPPVRATPAARPRAWITSASTGPVRPRAEPTRAPTLPGALSRTLRRGRALAARAKRPRRHRKRPVPAGRPQARPSSRAASGPVAPASTRASRRAGAVQGARWARRPGHHRAPVPPTARGPSARASLSFREV